MTQRYENIPIKKTPSAPVAELGTATTAQQKRANAETTRNFKIAAVLFSVVALLILIALLSYTSADEENAQLTVRDMMGVIRGDEALRVRFETTHNWLGLLGAVISHWLYSSTVGIWALAFPMLMLIWARDVFRVQRITPLVTKRSIATLTIVCVLAAFMATLQMVSWMPTIDRIFSGAVGQFLAAIVSQFIGVLGSAVVWLVALGFVLFFGFNVPLGTLGTEARLKAASLRDKLARKAGSGEVSDVDNQNSDLSEEDDATEPADNTTLPTSNVLRPLSTTLGSGKTKVPVKKEPDLPFSNHEEYTPISGSVRIVRPAAKKPEPPIPPIEADQFDEPDQQIPDIPQALTPREIQNRIRELHPTREVRELENEDPAELEEEQTEDVDNEVQPSLPLFETKENPPSRVQKPLTVLVDESVQPENEVQLESTTLYDEQIVYKPPTIKLLVETKDEGAVDDAELERNATILQERLETFKVRIENLTVTPGPVVTQYEFVPASGIKVAQIESLADDIALALKAQGVRIIAPIPGKGTVGIEIPNTNPAIVRFSSIIKSPKYHDPSIRLPIAMGKTVSGEVYCADLVKMPHLLIAGATGKGKSVGINTIIASLLYKMHPKDLKFVIIDPKRVEMTLYQSLKNHFLAVSPDINETIITEPANAVMVLKSVVEEMQQRYTVLAQAGQRNIADYNAKAASGTLKSKGGIEHRPIPYIVVVIDELADLMMTARKEVEEPIVRLAQLARAVGIHCIVATQRPSVDVVTGLIKANFPARIAYQVASRIDSRTILDASGAEHLIGNGDMLFNPGNMTKPLRMQNAFISTEEVEALCDWIGNQRGYSKPYTLPSVAKKRDMAGNYDDDHDELFEDAARIFIQLQQASVSTLQRRLKVGYARAARIVDELEMAGIVGPADGSKGRAVLLQSEAELEAYL